MQPGTSPFGQFSLSPLPFLYSINGELSSSTEGFDSSRVLFLASLWLFQGGGPMDLSKVGEKILSSVRSARSLGVLPSTSDRPEVPARVAAAAAIARALAALPPDQRLNLPSSSAELSSMYGSKPDGPIVEELEEQFYEEDFDPVLHMLEHIPSGEDELEYYENKATLRLAQLDMISARLSHHVMEHHEEMVKGMQLVKELERDVKIATVICMNGRRHLTSSMHEVSRDLIVTTSSKEKQALLDLLPVLGELCNALSMRKELEKLVDAGNFCKAFQVLSEYLQLLDTVSGVSAVQEMSRNVEAWLGSTLQKLDSLMLQVCKVFKEEKYITVVDAYALIGDASGLAEKIQSFFMQEVLSDTHSALKTSLQEDQDTENLQMSSRLTYSDLCLQIPESKFRHCLLRTLAVLFTLMGSYYSIMSFKPEEKVPIPQMQDAPQKPSEVSQRPQEFKKMNLASGWRESGVDTDASRATSADRSEFPSVAGEYATRIPSVETSGSNGVILVDRCDSADQPLDDSAASSSGSPWYELRRDATSLVSQALQRGRKNFWQLMTSRVSVLLSSNAFCSTSIHQFLRNYEDLSAFVLAGEAFCGAKAYEFRNKLKIACESYYSNYHKQNIYAIKMVLERECWQKLPQDAIEMVSFAGLLGDGAPLIASSHVSSASSRLLGDKWSSSGETATGKSVFSDWVKVGNPFLLKVSSPANGDRSSLFGDRSAADFHSEKPLSKNNNVNHSNGDTTALEDENEDLLADFIDEDSQLPSRISKAGLARNHSSKQGNDETTIQTGSSLCLLRFMDKYARLMQKLGMVNVEFFKGLCQFFAMYYYAVFETFGHQDNDTNGKSVGESLSYRLKTAVNRISQDCEQWLKPQLLTSSSSSSISMNTVPTPTPPGSSFGLKERCTAVDSISLVAQILHRSKPHLQLMLLQNNPVIVEDFFVHLVDSVPDLIEHIHRTTARLLLHINGYIDRIANAKWEVKELGMEHNGYVDLLLGEFKHYKTRLAHAGILKEVQDLLLEYGVEIVAETLVEGLSRVKRCTDEGRALMSLDLQVLINGLQHFVPKDVKPKLQIVEAFIKAYYLPETEYVHWARAHPEYSKSQIVGLVNLVASMKGWKRKTRLEILEKIE